MSTPQKFSVVPDIRRMSAGRSVQNWRMNNSLGTLSHSGHTEMTDAHSKNEVGRKIHVSTSLRPAPPTGGIFTEVTNMAIPTRSRELNKGPCLALTQKRGYWAACALRDSGVGRTMNCSTWRASDPDLFPGSTDELNGSPTKPSGRIVAIGMLPPTI